MREGGLRALISGRLGWVGEVLQRRCGKRQVRHRTPINHQAIKVDAVVSGALHTRDCASRPGPQSA